MTYIRSKIESSQLDESPLGITSGTAEDTGITIAKTPTPGSAVMVLVNGARTKVRNGSSDSASPFFFGPDATTIRTLSTIQAQDKLYFNHTSAGYDLETDDIISLVYTTD